MMFLFFFSRKTSLFAKFPMYLSLSDPILSPSCVNPFSVLVTKLGIVSSFFLKNYLPKFSYLFNLDLLIIEYAAQVHHGNLPVTAY